MIKRKSRINPYMFDQEDSLTRAEESLRIRQLLIKHGIIIAGRNIEDLIYQYTKLHEEGLIS